MNIPGIFINLIYEAPEITSKLHPHYEFNHFPNSSHYKQEILKLSDKFLQQNGHYTGVERWNNVSSLKIQFNIVSKHTDFYASRFLIRTRKIFVILS